MSGRARKLLEALVRESEEISFQIRTLDALKSRLEGFSFNLRGDGAQSVHKPHSDRIGAYTARVVDLERELEAKVQDYAERRRIVTDVLFKMEDTRHAALLHSRYIENEPWRDVAQTIGVSVTWTYALHNRALKEFENLFYN